jgi:hypothetical protein
MQMIAGSQGNLLKGCCFDSHIFLVNYLCFVDVSLGIVFLHAFQIGKPCTP